MIHDIILLGIQGSGKGTQARRFLAEHPMMHYLEMGQIFRNLDPESEKGKKVRSFINEGKMVPSEITVSLIEDQYNALEDDQMIILDGFPRKIDQFEMYRDMAKAQGRSMHCVEFMLDQDEAIARIQGRAEEQGRVDDLDMEKVQSRMQWTKEETGPVLDWYKENNLYSTVDAAGDTDEVYQLFHDLIHGLVD